MEEKYLNIILVGHNVVKAFQNKNKKSPKEPDFVGNGVAVWVNKMQPKVEEKMKVEEEYVL